MRIKQKVRWSLLRWSLPSHHIWPGLIRTPQKGTNTINHSNILKEPHPSPLFPVRVTVWNIVLKIKRCECWWCFVTEINTWRMLDYQLYQSSSSWHKLGTNLSFLSSVNILGSEISQSRFNYKIYLIRSDAERRSDCLACIGASQSSRPWWMTWGFCLVIGIINLEFFAQYSFKFGPNN